MPDTSVASRLKPFQLEDVLKLAGQNEVLIANDMGTGKTYEAIARDETIRKVSRKAVRTLVIAPLSVLPVWKMHYKDLMPHLSVVQVDKKNRAKSWADFLSSEADVYLVHWDVLRLMPELQKLTWTHVIADECHRACNRKALMTQALKKIKAEWKTGLSGTPTTGNPDKLWSVLNWLKPLDWRSFWRFYSMYVDYDIQYPQGYHKIKGPKNETDLLHRIEPYYVRRRKADVLTELPEKYYSTLWVDLDSKQRRAYEQMRKEQIAWVENMKKEEKPIVAPVVIAVMTRLQQFADAYADVDTDTDGTQRVILTEPSSKLDALMDLLEDNPDEPFVVFSQFRQLINLLAKRLDKAKIPYGLLTGDVDQESRERNVAEFQSGRLRVFAGTIQAGGVGITLHRASTVVFLDRSWSPAINAQAEDRLHRIGQRNAVQVIDIIARNTVDLGRKQRLEQKWNWIERLLGDSLTMQSEVTDL